MEVTLINVEGIFSYNKNLALSHANKCGDTIYLSGQVAVDSDGNLVGKDDAGVQATYIFENIKRVLAEAGASLDDVVKHVVYYTSPDDFPWINNVRLRYLSKEPYSCGTAICVQDLAWPGLLVEIEVIAVIKG